MSGGMEVKKLTLRFRGHHSQFVADTGIRDHHEHSRDEQHGEESPHSSPQEEVLRQIRIQNTKVFSCDPRKVNV